MTAAAYAYFFVLFATFTIVTAVGEWPHVKTAFTILIGNALANAYALATWDNDPWLAFLIIDAASAAAILHNADFRLQWNIGLIFVFKVVIHAVYGLVLNVIPFASNPVAYWWICTASGFAQLLLLAVWFIKSVRVAQAPG